MHLIDFLSSFSFESVDGFEKIVRNGKTYYRLHWKDFRIYFESLSEKEFLIHYLIPKHTWNDFLFRSKLPFNEKAIEKNPQFWQFLENLKK